jgi:hypothetical protein
MKGCHNYEQLGIIFNRSTATGILRRSLAQSPPNSKEKAILTNCMQKEGIQVREGGVGCMGRPEGPSETFVDLCNPHDSGSDGTRHGGGRHRGKEPMAEDFQGVGGQGQG